MAGKTQGPPCSKCGGTERYVRWSEARGRYTNPCVACHRSGYARRYDPAKRRVECLKSSYGLTEAAYNKIVSDQNGLCDICGVDPSTSPNAKGKARCLHVDHDHRTGKVRSLLCNHCNLGIGHLKDDPDTLRRAASYIERHQAD